MKNDTIVPGQRLVLRSYFDADCTYRPYRNMIHDSVDCKITQLSELQELFTAAGVDDGDEFEIVIVKTGNRPFGDRKYKLQAYNFYAPETHEQERLRKLRESGKV